MLWLNYNSLNINKIGMRSEARDDMKKLRTCIMTITIKIGYELCRDPIYNWRSVIQNAAA